jgi:hypothetical protein
MRARVWIATLTGATLAATVGLVGSGTLSTANASGPVAQPAGTLALTTTSGTGVDGWSFTKTGNVSGVPDTTQAVGAVAGTCTLTPTTGPLVTLSGTNGAAGSPVGYANHSIGVTQGVTNSSCAKVNINKTTTKVGKTNVTTTSVESLTLALSNGADGALYDPLFGAFQASGATLDLEVHEGTQVQAAVSLAGGTPTVYTLIAYDADDAKPANLPTTTTWCLIDDDSEHATTKGDNCSWTIPGPNFDKVVLTPVAGWFSLEGGGDWAAASGDHRSTFSLVSFYDGSLNCTDQNFAAVPASGSGLITGVALTRLDNGVSTPQGCVALPYTLANDGSVATFHKPTVAGQASAQFAVTVTRTWLSGAPLPVPAPKADWENGEGPIDLGLCPVGLVGAYDIHGVPTLLDYNQVGADQSTKPDTQFACVYQETPTYDGATGKLTVVDYIYFTGDIKFPTA